MSQGHVGSKPFGGVGPAKLERILLNVEAAFFAAVFYVSVLAAAKTLV